MNTLLRVQEVFRDVFDDDSLVLTEQKKHEFRQIDIFKTLIT